MTLFLELVENGFKASIDTDMHKYYESLRV